MKAYLRSRGAVVIASIDEASAEWHVVRAATFRLAATAIEATPEDWRAKWVFGADHNGVTIEMLDGTDDERAAALETLRRACAALSIEVRS